MKEVLSYSLNKGMWEELTDLDCFSVANLRGSEENDNKVLLLDRYSTLRIFPDFNKTESAAILISKKFHIPSDNGARRIFRIKKVRVVYEGDEALGIVIRVYNDRYTSGYLDVDVNLKGSGRWAAVVGGYKGDYFDIRVLNALMVQDIEVEVTILS